MATSVEKSLETVRDNLRAGRALNHGIRSDHWRLLLNRYSRFEDRRDEQGFLIDSEEVLDSPHTPRPALHLMASTQAEPEETWGSFWDPFGGGFSCLKSVLAGRMTSHLDTNYVPTAPEPQDVRRFFIHEEGQSWPMFPLASTEVAPYESWRCVQGLDVHRVSARRADLACELAVCVHPRLPLEVWTMRITNCAHRPRRLSWFSCLRVNVDSVPAYYFVPRVVCEGILEEGAMVFLNHDQNNRHPRQAFFTARPGFDGYDMMGEVFDGQGGRGPVPAAVLEGRCRNLPGLQPYAGLVAAAQFDAVLEPGETKEWHCIYGACPYEESARRDYLKRVRAEVLSEPGHTATTVAEVWSDRITAGMARTPDPELDRYYNVWSKVQARSQVRFCRALDKIGYRDVLQDLLGVCECESARVRSLLCRTLAYQFPDGRAPRQYASCPGAGHDLRMYMDSASWIPDTLVEYIRETGDFDLLDVQVPYFDAATDAPSLTNTGTVYEHTLRAVRSLVENTGYHGLCRIGYGDWNDALSGIGGERGVSVWLSCACVHAARCLAELAARVGRSDDARDMDQIAETMSDRINEHAWVGAWYLYAINGEGEPIGSSRCEEGRIHLNVNTWALFTGVARKGGREEQVWQALEQLATPFGHMLLTPPYTARSRAGVGRIADQKPGMFENGSIYHHGEAFYLYALIEAGRGGACYHALRQTLPSEAVQDLATGPRHQQSNFTVGPDHANYGMQLFSNFSGSVSWYRRVIERMLGVRAGFDELIIAPCPPDAWREYEVRRTWRKRRLHVRFRRSDRPGVRITSKGHTFERAVPLHELSETELNEISVQFA
jgi:cellobiose phosphorylase